MRTVRLLPATWTAIFIFCLTLVVFLISPVHQVTDSNYSMLLSQSLLEHGTFKLDQYALPRFEPYYRGYYNSDGPIYQLELANNHTYYHLPPGSSVLSVPYVAVMKLFGIEVTNPDGTFNRLGELKIEASLAALLTAFLAVIFFYTARLLLPVSWSAIIALGAAFGTQAWSTASRAMWTDTWGIVLLSIAVYMLLAQETGKRNLNPIVLASVLAWTYFVRPTNAVHILAVTVYLLIYHRRLFLPYALTGAAWFAGFVFYSWHNYGHLQPAYYQAKRLNFSVFWTALAGNLFSPARGLLVYLPILFFVAYLLIRFRHQIKSKPLVTVVIAILVGHLIAVSAFVHWWGGHCFGPRFTTGLLPWFVLLTILGVDAMLKWKHESADIKRPRRLRLELLAGSALLLLSVFINGCGALSEDTWFWNARPVGIDERPERLWDWHQPQFLAGWVKSTLPDEFKRASGPIDFSTPESSHYLWYGWSDPEKNFRWTDGKEASVTFSLDSLNYNQLYLKLSPFLPKGKVNEQRVDIVLNGQIIDTLVLNEERVYEYRVRIPEGVLRSRNVLMLWLPNANSPKALGTNGADSRQLGVAMFVMELESSNVVHSSESIGQK